MSGWNAGAQLLCYSWHTQPVQYRARGHCVYAVVLKSKPHFLQQQYVSMPTFLTPSVAHCNTSAVGRQHDTITAPHACRCLTMPCSTRQALLCTPTHCSTSAIHSAYRAATRQPAPCRSSTTLHAACPPPVTKLGVHSGLFPASTSRHQSMRIPQALQTNITSASPDDDEYARARTHAQPHTHPGQATDCCCGRSPSCLLPAPRALRYGTRAPHQPSRYALMLVVL